MGTKLSSAPNQERRRQITWRSSLAARVGWSNPESIVAAVHRV
jgi:hypothetical protein